MANEPIPAMRGEIRALRETTYGTDAGIAAGDVRYVENWEALAKPLLQPRTGLSPYRGGWRPRYVGRDNTWSAEVEITFPTIGDGLSNPPTAGQRMELDPWLAACGFEQAAYSDVNNSFTYTLNSVNHDSATLQERFYNPAQNALIGYEYLGARCDWTITIDGEGVWRLAMTGAAKTGTQIGTAPISALTYSFENGPAIGSNTTATLVSLDDNGDTTYAGVVSSATITGNMNLVVVPGLSGSVGPAKVVLNPQRGVGVELVMETQLYTEWDPQTYMADATGADNVYSLAIASTSGTNSATIGTFYIAGTDIEILPNEGGRMLWRLSFDGVYPEVATDGGGLVPANNLSIVFDSAD